MQKRGGQRERKKKNAEKEEYVAEKWYQIDTNMHIRTEENKIKL